MSFILQGEANLQSLAPQKAWYAEGAINKACFSSVLYLLILSYSHHSNSYMRASSGCVCHEEYFQTISRITEPYHVAASYLGYLDLFCESYTQLEIRMAKCIKLVPVSVVFDIKTG